MDPGQHHVSFMEVSMDFELHVNRAVPSDPQAMYKGETLQLPERARVLKLALAIVQQHLPTGPLLLVGCGPNVMLQSHHGDPWWLAYPPVLYKQTPNTAHDLEPQEEL